MGPGHPLRQLVRLLQAFAADRRPDHAVRNVLGGRLAEIADAIRKYLRELGELCVAELAVVVGRVDRPQLAADDVVGLRHAGNHAWRAGHRQREAADAEIVTVGAEIFRSEEHTSEQSLMRNSYAVFCLKKKNDAERKALAA